MAKGLLLGKDQLRPTGPVGATEPDAALCEAPFEYVRSIVKLAHLSFVPKSCHRCLLDAGGSFKSRSALAWASFTAVAGDSCARMPRQ